MKDQTKGTLLAAASGLLFGVSPAASKYIYANGGTPIMVLFYRVAAIPVLYLLVRLSGEDLKITWKQFWPLLAVALLGGVITPLCLQVAYEKIAAGTAITIHYLYSVFILLGCVLFFREKLDWLKAVCIAMCVAGVYLLYLPTGAGDVLGLGVALLSSLTYAAYSVMLDKSRVKNISAFKLQFYVNVISWICVAVIGFSLGEVKFDLQPVPLLVMIFYHGFGMVGAAILYQLGVRYLGSSRAAIISTLEPMTGVLLGVILWKEVFNLRIGAGIILILTAAVVITVTRSRNAARIAAEPRIQERLQPSDEKVKQKENSL